MLCQTSSHPSYELINVIKMSCVVPFLAMYCNCPQSKALNCFSKMVIHSDTDMSHLVIHNHCTMNLYDTDPTITDEDRRYMPIEK